MSEQNIVQLEAIQALVLKSLKQVLATRDAAKAGSIDENTILVGPGAVLDSLGLVTFALELEHQIEDHFGFSIVLADDQELTRKNSPFANVHTLAEFILTRVGEKEVNPQAQ